VRRIKTLCLSFQVTRVAEGLRILHLQIALHKINCWDPRISHCSRNRSRTPDGSQLPWLL